MHHGVTTCLGGKHCTGVKRNPHGVDIPFLPAGLRVAQPCRYCFTQLSKDGFFAPQGRHVASIDVKFGTGERTFGRNVGIQPPKLSTFRILAINLPIKSHLFAQFLRNSHILYASPGEF